MAKNSSKAPPPTADKVEDGPVPPADASQAAEGDTQPEASQDGDDDPSATAPAPPVEGEAPDSPQLASDEGDGSAPPPFEQAEPGETVPALVLSDNHLGKVGEVVQVPAEHAEQLRRGGLIDTHPNAIRQEA